MSYIKNDNIISKNLCDSCLWTYSKCINVPNILSSIEYWEKDSVKDCIGYERKVIRRTPGERIVCDGKGCRLYIDLANRDYFRGVEMIESIERNEFGQGVIKHFCSDCYKLLQK